MVKFGQYTPAVYAVLSEAVSVELGQLLSRWLVRFEESAVTGKSYEKGSGEVKQAIERRSLTVALREHGLIIKLVPDVKVKTSMYDLAQRREDGQPEICTSLSYRGGIRHVIIVSYLS